MPFVRFRVERVLASGDDSSPEGRTGWSTSCARCSRSWRPGAMRMELTRMVSSRLAVPTSVFEQRLAAAAGAVRGRAEPRQARTDARAQLRSSAARTGSGARMPGNALHGREDTERAFLALCIAAPEEGEQALARLDVDEYFSSELLRRAAGTCAPAICTRRWRPARRWPSLEDDAELKALLAELVVESGRNLAANPAMLEAQRLQLELARVDRQIQRARGEQSGEISDLARRKATVKLDFDRAYARVLEETGDRE